jgi:hypothetical protein
MESIPLSAITGETKRFKRLAVLDTPFAEGVQACMTRFYSAVGLPNFNPERFKHLIAAAQVGAGT